ncbi:MAG: C4-type zinc ribbon domain-containing protein [Elusimicrobiota bacterium]
MNEQLSKLVELQNIDSKIGEANNNIEKINGEIDFLQETLVKEKEQIETAKKNITDGNILKKEKEIEIASIEGKIKKHNMELNAVKTNDAYKALLTEMENGKNEKLKIEDELLALMETDEKNYKDIKNLQKEYEKKEKEFAEKKVLFENDLRKLGEFVTQQSYQRTTKLVELPKNIIDKYENIRKNKNGIAVVIVENNACGGCHRNLPIHIIDELKKGKDLISCNNCMRILYQKTVKKTE